MRKKKVIFHSNHCLSKTGFGRNAREVLTYLYKTGKYNLIEYAAGLKWSDPAAQRVPWPCYGTWPDNDQEIAHIQQHPEAQAIYRQISYGSHNIDKLIAQEKPDIYIGAEDVWAFNGYWDKKWWNKITSALHTTLDSLPILDTAITAASKTNQFYVWAQFAEKDMRTKGHENVKTIHGAINPSTFSKLNPVIKRELRDRHSLKQDAFIIGFVFRNQLRKSVPNLIEGFKSFQMQNPAIKSKLLLHTNWEEMAQGWNIPKLIQEFNIASADVLATYVCRACGEYEVKSFRGFDADCSFCGCKHNPKPSKPEERTGQLTPNINFGLTEKQLNEVYNLMDVYVHPFTSGGQELPIQEAKLAELVTMVTSYSCGLDWCYDDTGGIPLDYSEYREHGTQFIKASTYPSSIAKQLAKFYNLPKAKKQEMGKIARESIIKRCSTEAVGKQFEAIIDNAPFCEWDFDMKEPVCNPDFPYPEIENDEQFIETLYKNILAREPDSDGFKHWLDFMNN